MHFRGTCNWCKETRWLTHGVCPECGRKLQALRDHAEEELRARREAESQAALIEQFAGQLDQPDEQIWADLGFRGD